jgi:predicted sulfurtransferase
MFRKLFVALLMMMAVGCAGMGTSAAKGEVPRMTKEELKAKLGTAEVVVLDVRAEQDWKEGEGKIVGAIRENPTSFEQWAAKYPKEKTLVLYCA